MSKQKIKFEDDENCNLRIRCDIGLTIEPYGYRQGQRIAVIHYNEVSEPVSFKQIVIAIYKLKTNCITISGGTEHIAELIAFLKKFINYCRIHVNLVGMNLTERLPISKVLCSYDSCVEGIHEDDSIVLFGNTREELASAQSEADRIRTENKFVGKIFIVHNNDLSSDEYEQILNTSIHYKTRYQRMY